MRGIISLKHSDNMYRSRKMLRMDGAGLDNNPRVLIMTYNLLFRAGLNSNFSKRKTARSEGREYVLMEEISNYKPDVLCLQEVEKGYNFELWEQRLERLGYSALFVSDELWLQGIAIAYKPELFSEIDSQSVSYQQESLSKPIEIVTTKHRALFVCLQFSKSFLQIRSKPSRNGLIVACTHLAPFLTGAYERVKQAGILLQSLELFSNTLKEKLGPDTSFYMLVAGDFNSSPVDAAYKSLTSKPVKFFGETKDVLGVTILREPGIKRNSMEWWRLKNPEYQSRACSAIEALEKFHNGIKSIAISLYSVAYRRVQAECTGKETTHDEPQYSFFGSGWQGLLDYIFVVCNWDDLNTVMIDSPEKCAELSGIYVVGLLEMPTTKDIGPHGIPQPQPGMFPSDHLCLMAEVELV